MIGDTGLNSRSANGSSETDDGAQEPLSSSSWREFPSMEGSWFDLGASELLGRSSKGFEYRRGEGKARNEECEGVRSMNVGSEECRL